MIVRGYSSACFTNPLTGQLECPQLIIPEVKQPDGGVSNQPNPYYPPNVVAAAARSSWTPWAISAAVLIGAAYLLGR